MDIIAYAFSILASSFVILNTVRILLGTNLMSEKTTLLEVGKAIKATRARKNWTQAKLAAESDLSRRTVERIESGVAAKDETLLCIYRALGEPAQLAEDLRLLGIVIHVECSSPELKLVKHRTLNGHRDRITSIVWDKENTILSGSYDCSVREWDIRTGECIRCLASEAKVYAVCNLDDYIVAGGRKGLTVWDRRTGLLRETKTICDIRCVRRLDEARFMATGSDGYLRIWSIQSSKLCLEAEIESHKDLARSCIRCGDRIVTASHDKSIRIWTLDGKLICTIQASSNDLNALCSINSETFAWEHLVFWQSDAIASVGGVVRF
jgi:WD40 repeat protein/DNA-binding XRE family transcriptional regulator